MEEDISDRKRVDQAKTDFIGLASHQLKTPLGIVRWGLELLLEAPEVKKMSKESRDTLKIIYETNVRMNTLVNDFLNVSRIDQGRVRSDP